MRCKLYKLLLLASVILVPSVGYSNGSLQGWCEKGNRTVLLGGLTSTTKVQQSFPACSVTVYVHGTVTLATLYSDNNTPPTTRTNPFTATSDGYWQFYAINGSYDIILNGGGFPSPFTISDVLLGGPTLDCSVYPGTTADIKIANCIAGLPSTGGTANALNILGTQTISSDICQGVTKPVDLLLGSATFTVSSNVTCGTSVMIHASIGTTLSLAGGTTFTVNNYLPSPQPIISGTGIFTYKGQFSIGYGGIFGSVPGEARDGVYIGQHITTDTSTHVPLSHYGVGLNLVSDITAAGNTATMIGGRFEPTLINTGGFTVNGGFGLAVSFAIGTGSTIPDATGILIDTPSVFPGGSATNVFGLNIGNITGFSGVNKAIETHAGDVYFGDNVTAVANPGINQHIIVSEIGGPSYTQIQAMTNDAGRYPLFSLLSSRTDAAGNQQGYLTWDYNTNTAGYKNIANISGWTKGSTPNQRGGEIRFATATDGMMGAAATVYIDSQGIYTINGSTAVPAISGVNFRTTGLSFAAGPTLNLNVNGASSFSLTTTSATLLPSSGSPLLIFRGSPSSNGDAEIRLLHSNSVNNWSIGANKLNTGLTFTPSTAAGGSTFTTPSLILYNTSHVGMGSTVSVGAFTGNTSTSVCRDPTAAIANTFSTCTSLEELKDDFQPITFSATEELLKLTPSSFRYKPSSDRVAQADVPYEYGLGAHAVYAIDPKLSTFYEGKLNGVDFNGVTAILIKGFQEMEARIKQLEAK